MEVFNQGLKQRFEGDFPGTTVELSAQGTDAALQAVLDDKLDVAAIGRALTEAERAKGLVATSLGRAKIAIIVGADNPFSGNLTFAQFAKIFRGEITDWSEVGGAPGPIRVIDRPEFSDTRQAFQPYPVFKSAPFATGATAVPVSQDVTADVIKDLGKDGISYAIANQVLTQKSVKIIPMHKTLPDDPRYPYSQPLAYVHKAAASPAAQAFLGLVTAPAGQSVIQGAMAGGIASAAGTPVAGFKASTSPSPTAGTPSPVASPGAGTASPTDTAIGTASPAAGDQTALVPGGGTAGTSGQADAGGAPWLWLLPLLLGGAGLWLLLRGRRGADGNAPGPTAGEVPVPPADPINPVSPPLEPAEPVVPPVGGEVAAEAAPAVPLPPVDPSAPPIPGGLGGAALAGGAVLAAGAAAGLAGQPEAIAAPLTSPEDLSGVADPAVFDLPNSDPMVIPEAPASVASEAPEGGLPGAALAAGAAIGGAALAGFAMSRGAAEGTPAEADLVSLDTVESGIGSIESDSGDTDPQVIDFGSSAAVEPIAEIPSSPSGSTESPGLSAAQLGGAFLAAGVGIGAAAVAARSSSNPPPGIPEDTSQTQVEAAKFDVGSTQDALDLSDVDAGLSDLPDGYGESRIVLLPRDPQSAYAYWDTPNEHKAELRQQGGQQLALRLCDVTDLDGNHPSPHNIQQYDCDEMARDWHLPIPVSDRDYIAEIGYIAGDGRWLMLARSLPVRIPPVYPSDWFEEHFLTIDWDQNLRGKQFLTLVPPSQRPVAIGGTGIHEQMFELAGGLDSMRSAGSLFGSIHQAPIESISSFVFPSGIGMWAVPTPSGMGMSGIGMSGIGMSGVGFSASMPPIRSRKFWLVADAELIIYGATEPDATVTIGGRPITLNPDGTFRFQMPFYDGMLDFPIWATAVDGEQTRSIQMKFNRETPQRRTNTKEEAQDESF
jgi:ABC-type phosphate transport system substrate-binding protein